MVRSTRCGPHLPLCDVNTRLPPSQRSVPPSPSMSSSSSSEALEGFCTLAASSSGAQLVMVIKQVLKHPHIFFFGELLQHKPVQDVSHRTHSRSQHLLTTPLTHRAALTLPVLVRFHSCKARSISRGSTSSASSPTARTQTTRVAPHITATIGIALTPARHPLLLTTAVSVAVLECRRLSSSA